MKKGIRTFKSMISAILVLILFAAIPTQAFAQVYEPFIAESPSRNYQGDTEDYIPDEENALPEAEILSEIEEERTENEKHFLLSNGCRVVASYEFPVHFKNDEDEWVDYDNTPEVKTVEIESFVEKEIPLTEQELKAIDQDVVAVLEEQSISSGIKSRASIDVKTQLKVDALDDNIKVNDGGELVKVEAVKELTSSNPSKSKFALRSFCAVAVSKMLSIRKYYCAFFLATTKKSSQTLNSFLKGFDDRS